MPSEQSLHEQRLHPSSLLFSLLKHLRQFLAPVAAMYFLSQKSDSWEIYAALAVIPLMIYEAWRYFNLRYQIVGGELIVREGVFFKNVRHVPIERIQSIDSTQNFLHRIFQVAEVRVETAGNTEPEAELRVLSLAARDQLRGIVFENGTSAQSPTEADGEHDLGGASDIADAPIGARFEFHLPASELALLGLNPARGLAILGIGVGLLGQFGQLEGASISGALSTISGGADLMNHAIAAIALIFAAGLAVLLLSLAATFVGLHDFTLIREGAEFRTQCGFFTRHTTTIPLGRVQFVSVKANLLLRLLGRSSIQIETAGGRTEGQGNSRRWLMPVVRNEFVPGLLAAIDSSIDLDQVQWQMLCPRAGRRRLFRALRFCLLLSIPPILFFDSWGALALAIGLPIVTTLALVLAHKAHQVIAWASSPFGTLLRSGVFTRTVGIVLAGRVQAVSMSSTPFDRRHDMATFRIDTAGAGKVGHRVSIEFIKREVGERLREELLVDLEENALGDGLARA